MTVRLGVDLVEVGAVEKVLAGPLRDRYLARLFAADEVDDCSVRARIRPERVALHLAAKEAVVKVLPGSSIFHARAVALVRDAAGGASIVLSEPFSQLAASLGLRELHVSVGSSRGYAVALVLAEMDRAPEPAASQATPSAS
jgi:phosphopantetheine--protein transferase-like protein